MRCFCQPVSSVQRQPARENRRRVHVPAAGKLADRAQREGSRTRVARAVVRGMESDEEPDGQEGCATVGSGSEVGSDGLDAIQGGHLPGPGTGIPELVAEGSPGARVAALSHPPSSAEDPASLDPWPAASATGAAPHSGPGSRSGRSGRRRHRRDRTPVCHRCAIPVAFLPGRSAHGGSQRLGCALHRDRSHRVGRERTSGSKWR